MPANRSLLLHESKLTLLYSLSYADPSLELVSTLRQQSVKEAIAAHQDKTCTVHLLHKMVQTHPRLGSLYCSTFVSKP